MSKALFIVSVIFVFYLSINDCFAQLSKSKDWHQRRGHYDFVIGVRVGEPSGVTAALVMGRFNLELNSGAQVLFYPNDIDKNNLSAKGLGFMNNLNLDYYTHFLDSYSSIFYFGPGIWAMNRKLNGFAFDPDIPTDSSITMWTYGLNFKVGVEYLFKASGIGLFVDFIPSIILGNNSNTGFEENIFFLQGGAGIKYKL